MREEGAPSSTGEADGGSQRPPPCPPLQSPGQTAGGSGGCSRWTVSLLSPSPSSLPPLPRGHRAGYPAPSAASSPPAGWRRSRLLRREGGRGGREGEREGWRERGREGERERDAHPLNNHSNATSAECQCTDQSRWACLEQSAQGGGGRGDYKALIIRIST